MKNLTIIFTSFKRDLANCPEIKVVESRSQFDPPSASRKRSIIAELEAEGYKMEEWIEPIINLSKANSINYLMLSSTSKGGGSFSLNNPQEYLFESEPWHSKLSTNPEEIEILKRARVIDQPNIAQTFTAVVCPKGSPPKLPEKLIYFRKGILLELNLPLRDYCETLASFYGFFNWQLLFAEGSATNPIFTEDFVTLKEGYQDFVRLFPQSDFSLWESKLKDMGLI